jgi:hypothetical protein
MVSREAKRTRRAATFVAGTILAVGLLPAGASASKRSTTATTSVDRGVATATAKCPSGQRATGGGFQLTPISESISVYPIESRKIGQRSWRVSAQRFGAPGAISATATAYCATNAPKTTASTANTALPGSGEQTGATATCPKGKAQAGGFFVPAGSPSRGVLESFRKSSRSWQSTAFAGGAGVTLTNYVYCARAATPKVRLGSVAGTGDRTYWTVVSEKCKHTAPIHGGWSQPEGFTVFVVSKAFFPYESLRSGRRWRTSGLYRDAGGGPTTLNSFAYCD